MSAQASVPITVVVEVLRDKGLNPELWDARAGGRDAQLWKSGCPLCGEYCLEAIRGDGDETAITCPRCENVEGADQAAVQQQLWDALGVLADGAWVEPAPRDDVQRENVEPWPAEVIPLESEPIPPMPLDGVPRVIRDHVEAVAEAVQVPTDLVLLVDLGALAVACQGLATVQLSEQHREQLSLYTLTVLPSGERKSATISEAVGPLQVYERAWRDRTRVAVATAQANLRALEKRQAKAEATLASADDPDKRAKAKRDLAEIIAEIDKADRGTQPRLLIDDTTPEAMSRILTDHGRIGVVSAEGGLFDTLAGRYSDGLANLDVVLKTYDAEDVRVDRIGRDPIEIDEPHLSIALSVQPHVVERAARNRALMERGLIPRFLVSAPHSLLGTRMVGAKPIPAAVRKGWAGALADLLQIAGTSVPFVHPVRGQFSREREGRHTLKPSPMALSAWQAFYEEIEVGLKPGTGIYANMTATGGKAAGLAARVAAILHLAEHRAPGLDMEIEPVTIMAATGIVRTHLQHAGRLLHGGADSQTLQDARAIMAWVMQHRVGSFSARDALDGTRRKSGGPDRMSRINPALALLDERGWIRPFRIDPPTVGRPPSPVFEINPAVMP